MGIYAIIQSSFGNLCGRPTTVMKGKRAMETINHIINLAETMLGPLSQQITPIGSTTLAASIIALSVLFAAPNRLAQIWGTIALAILGVIVLFAADYAMVLFVFGCGLVGLVRSQNRSAQLQKQLDKLSRVVHQLELAENHRLIQSLNPPSPPTSPQHDAPSISPSEQTEDATDQSKIHVMKSLRP
jgi:hypothetical protein